MTIKSPSTGSRTQEPLRFPGRTHPPTSDTDKTSLKADREGPGRTAPGDQRHRGHQRDPQSPSKNKRKLTNTHQDPSRKHQGCSIISQNNFLFDFAKQSRAPSPKGTDPRSTNDNKKPSDRITHAGTIKISRLSKPPNLRCCGTSTEETEGN